MTPAGAQRPARAFLRALASLRQIRGLYPAGHPNRIQALQEALRHVRELEAAAIGVPAIFVTRHSFYLGDVLLARESLSLFRLVEAFEGAGLETIELTPATIDEDLLALVEVIDGERPLEPQLGGILCNRIAPKVAATPEPDIDLTELRAAYGLGLEFLRETSMRVVAGREIDLDAAAHLVQRLADESLKDPSTALLLTTVKSYDEYTYYHMLNVALLSITLAQAIGLRPDQVQTLGLGGLLHDVGKAEVPEEVLFHVGRLNEEQWRIIQRHPVDGAGMVFRTGEGLHHPAATVVLEHHAAYDLSGYPSLSHRPRPSIPARLVAVTDCFDAVTSRRAYRSPAGRRDALRILESGAGRGFDPRVVRLFTSLLGIFPIGSLVLLDSREVGLVVRNHPERHGAPTVLVVLDPAGNTVEPDERDLAVTGPDGQPRWRVVQTVDPDQLGVDVVGFLTTGQLEASGDEERVGEGLVHEPSYGEVRPDGYVDTHNQPHLHRHVHGDTREDPDISPEIELPDDDR